MLCDSKQWLVFKLALNEHLKDTYFWVFYVPDGQASASENVCVLVWYILKHLAGQLLLRYNNIMIFNEIP